MKDLVLCGSLIGLLAGLDDGSSMQLSQGSTIATPTKGPPSLHRFALPFRSFGNSSGT